VLPFQFVSNGSNVEDGTWEQVLFNAHPIGVNAVSWAPSPVPGSLITASGGSTQHVKRFVTAGCDNQAKIWRLVKT
jgi:protein transport protein SEC13